jgi:Ca-activated chloride channel family protein
VTFLSSWRLLLLVGPLALLVAYLWMQRNRHKTAVRFTSVEMLASVAPRRPGWQRHIPAGALLAAVLLLVIGFAQPVWAERVPRKRATVVLAFDTSQSMVANDVAPSRFAAAQSAARRFVNELPKGVRLGLVSFSSKASVLVAPTADRDSVLGGINTLKPGGGTATGDALDLSLSAIKAVPRAADGSRAPAAIVLMSDGTPTIGRGDRTAAQTVTDATTAAKAAKVGISTIAFGTQDGIATVQGVTVRVPSDPEAMKQISAATGGQTFTAETAGQLKSVYAAIGKAVGYDVHHHEVTAWFTGVALVVAMAAGVTALIWNQRLL